MVCRHYFSWTFGAVYLNDLTKVSFYTSMTGYFDIMERSTIDVQSGEAVTLVMRPNWRILHPRSSVVVGIDEPQFMRFLLSRRRTSAFFRSSSEAYVSNIGSRG